MHTASVRSSALGTRIATTAATPPYFATVPEPQQCHPAPLSKRAISEEETFLVHAKTVASKKALGTTRRKLKRPTSAPVRRRTGIEGTGGGVGAVETPSTGGVWQHRPSKVGRAVQRGAERPTEDDDGLRRRTTTSGTIRVRLGQVSDVLLRGIPVMEQNDRGAVQKAASSRRKSVMVVVQLRTELGNRSTCTMVTLHGRR